MAGVLLLDGDRRRQALDVVDLRLLHLADELPGVGAEALDVAPLALGVDRVHGERALARAARAAADGHLVAGDVDVDVLEVVLAGAADGDDLGQLGRSGRGERVDSRRAPVRAICRGSSVAPHVPSCTCRTRRSACAGVRLPRIAATSSGVPAATIRPPASPPSGPRSMTQSAVLITSRLCSMTSTVLPASTKPCSTSAAASDVVEVQAGGRLVEEVERPAGALLDQLAGELDPLGLAAGERGRGWPSLM